MAEITYAARIGGLTRRSMPTKTMGARAGLESGRGVVILLGETTNGAGSIIWRNSRCLEASRDVEYSL